MKIRDSYKKIAGGVVVLGLVFYSGFSIGSQRFYEVQKVYSEGSAESDLSDFWKVWNLINERHPNGSEVTNQEKVWGAIKGLTESLGDPYTTFFTPKEAKDLNIDLSGEFYGVGMEVGVRDQNLVVITPIKDSPAEKAGVRSGDIILTIDDAIAQTLSLDEAVDRIRGQKGTEVTLKLLSEGDKEPHELTLVRGLIKIPTVESELRKDGVFLVRLFDFSSNSEADFQKALADFVTSKSHKLIIDLRGNPGGYLGSAINITSWFLEEGTVIVSERSPFEEDNMTYRSNGNFLEGDFDIVVLVDGGSASASEIMAGALQEHGRAKLVGTQTFGKGSVQELVHLKDNTELKITVAEWLTPNGNSISKQGLTPDVVVEFDEDLYKENKKDNQLEKAAELLLAK